MRLRRNGFFEATQEFFDEETTMPLEREIQLTCPTCGSPSGYSLKPTEDRPLVTLVTCRACATPFGVEVRLTVTVATSVCRLGLPSTTRLDALDDIQTLPEPEEDLAF